MEVAETTTRMSACNRLLTWLTPPVSNRPLGRIANSLQNVPVRVELPQWWACDQEVGAFCLDTPNPEEWRLHGTKVYKTLLWLAIESPAHHNQAGLKHSLFCLVNLSKPYLLLAFQQARFIKGEMSILGLAPPCTRSVGNQSGHSSKWHFVIISASVKPIWDMIYVDKG